MPLWLQLWQSVDLSRSQARGRRGTGKSSKGNTTQNFRTPQSLGINAIADVRAACKDAPGFPRVEYTAAARNGAGCGQPCSSPQEPPTFPCPTCIVSSRWWWRGGVVAASPRAHRKASGTWHSQWHHSWVWGPESGLLFTVPIAIAVGDAPSQNSPVPASADLFLRFMYNWLL